MSSVYSRTFVSGPARDAHDTWRAIIDLLTRSCSEDDRAELIAVTGTASSVIADQAPREAPIIVTSDGPRTRIYCLYDEDAVEGSDSNEGPLGFDPLEGAWSISLPCAAEDLAWVNAALARHSERITARDIADGIAFAGSEQEVSAGLTFDPAGFLAS